MSNLSAPKKKNLFIGAILLVMLVASVWAFSAHEDLLASIKLGIALSALPLAWFALRQLKNEQINSGLSEDEFLLKQAGGATELLIQSVTVRGIGRFLVFFQIVMAVVAAVSTKTLFYTVFIVALTGLLFIPLAVACFRSAAKSRRAAERAGANLNGRTRHLDIGDRR